MLLQVKGVSFYIQPIRYPRYSALLLLKLLIEPLMLPKLLQGLEHWMLVPSITYMAQRSL